jgi:hypothetical protein
LEKSRDSRKVEISSRTGRKGGGSPSVLECIIGSCVTFGVCDEAPGNASLPSGIPFILPCQAFL